MKTSNHDHNLQMSHILCLIESKIHHASIDVHKFINSSKYSYISIHDGHGSIMLYDIHMHLNFFNIIINDSSKYTTNLILVHEKQDILYVCGVHSCSIFTFINKLQIIIQHFLKYCPIIIKGDFIVNILKDNNHGRNKQELLDFIDKLKLES